MTTNIDFLLRFIAILLLSARYSYWIVAEIRDHRIKQKTISSNFLSLVQKTVIVAIGILLFIQLFGVDIFPFQKSILLNYFGFSVFTISIILMFVARIQLGANWAHAADFQIKKDHSLVTHGIYRYIRHPIYTGFILSFLGVQLLVNSSLFFFFVIILPVVSYYQAVKEERLLESYFAKDYQEYKKRSKMFIPYLF